MWTKSHAVLEAKGMMDATPSHYLMYAKYRHVARILLRGGGTGHRCQGTPSKKGKLFGFGPLFFWGGGWRGAAVFIYHYFFRHQEGGHGPRAPLATSLAKYHIEKIDTHCAMMQTCPLSMAYNVHHGIRVNEKCYML